MDPVHKKTDLLLVQGHAKQCGEGRLCRLDNLAEGNGTGRQRKDREAVGGGGAESDGNAGKDVVFGRRRERARIGSGPQEEGINDTDAQLQRGNCQGETGRAAGGLECHLVGDVVVVIAKVPQSEVGNESDVDATLLLAGGRRHLRDSVHRSRVLSGRKQRHGAWRGEGTAREQHARAARRDASAIAASNQGRLHNRKSVARVAPRTRPSAHPLARCLPISRHWSLDQFEARRGMGVRGAKRGHLHCDTIPGIRGKGAGHKAILAAGRSGFVWMGRNKDPTYGADPRPANRPQRRR